MMTGYYDIHTHILPEVDDGSDSMEESFEIIRQEVAMGVENILFTPHYRKGLFEEPESRIYARYKMLSLELKSRFPKVTVALGCELHASMDIEKIFEERRYVTIAGTNSVLLEFSGRHTKSFIKERISTIMGTGHMPVLAHVERIPALIENMGFLKELKEVGVEIQVNADSILGREGRRLKSLTGKLLKNNLVDYIGSDVHNTTERASHIGECADYIEKKYGEEFACKIFIDNPGRLF